MLPPITLTFNIEQDFDPTRTLDEIIDAATEGTRRVSIYMVTLLKDYLYNWEQIPDFYITTPRIMRSPTLTSIACEVETTDRLFWWISNGVNPYSFFSDSVMVFPYVPRSRYASYNPKTGTGESGPSKSLRHGPKNVTHFISERDIRPRDIPGKAKEGHSNDIAAAFMEGFK